MTVSYNVPMSPYDSERGETVAPASWTQEKENDLMKVYFTRTDEMTGTTKKSPKAKTASATPIPAPAEGAPAAPIPEVKPRIVPSQITPYDVGAISNVIRRALIDADSAVPKSNYIASTISQASCFTSESSRQVTLIYRADKRIDFVKLRKQIEIHIPKRLAMESRIEIQYYDTDTGLEILIKGGTGTFRNGVKVEIIFYKVDTEQDISYANVLHGYDNCGELLQRLAKACNFLLEHTGISYQVEVNGVVLGVCPMTNDLYQIDNILNLNSYHRISYGVTSQALLFDIICTSHAFALHDFGMNEDLTLAIENPSPLLVKFQEYVRTKYAKSQAKPPYKVTAKALSNVSVLLNQYNVESRRTSLVNEYYSEQLLLERIEETRTILNISEELMISKLEAFKKTLGTKKFSFEVLSKNPVSLSRILSKLE